MGVKIKFVSGFSLAFFIRQIRQKELLQICKFRKNAEIEKNLKLSLKILKSLKIYKVEPTVLVSLLAREYRLMYYVKNLYNKMSMSDIMSYLSLADWQINKFYTNSSKFSNKELLGNLVKLCDIDLNIKKGVYDKDISLYGFLMDACS